MCINTEHLILIRQQKTKELAIPVSEASAKLSGSLKEMLECDEDKSVNIPSIYEGKICKRAFEFCEKYITSPYRDISHPIDDQKELPNYYNEFLNDMTSNSVIALLLLSDYLAITPLTELICFHLAYLMRDMESEQRLKYFHITDLMGMEYVEM